MELDSNRQKHNEDFNSNHSHNVFRLILIIGDKEEMSDKKKKAADGGKEKDKKASSSKKTDAEPTLPAASTSESKDTHPGQGSGSGSLDFEAGVIFSRFVYL